jgi:UDP-glucose 4-epimerase
MEKKGSIIVTGGAGFIGSHTVVELIANGYEPIIIDDFRNSEKFIIDRIKEIVNRDITVYSFDCCDKQKLQEVFAKHNPTGVIHFAADKAVGESVADPLKYYSNNLGSLSSILEVSVANNVQNVVFSSSCTVYGEPEEIPVKESTPMGITASPYGYTKQVCERICRDTAYAYPELKITLLRYFNPIGAHKSGLIGELPIGVPNNLVPLITQTGAGLRAELTVHGDDYNTEDGTCIRDYIHVVDLANAHVKALDKKSEESVSVFNVGTGVGSSVLDVIKSFESVNNVKLKYKIGPRREGDAVSVYANNDKVVKELGWQPKFSLDDSMRDAWNWQLKLKSI